MPPEESEQRHVVVFDANVVLDVGFLLGPPFTWRKFDARAAQEASAAVPHPDDAAIDSLRAMAVCTTGRFAGSESLEVWTNAHIDKIVRGKASQSVTPDAETGYRGLGWSAVHAQGLVDDLITELAGATAGGTLGDHYPDGNPPLDHEDGMVFGACRVLAAEDPLCQVYCITRDREFLAAHKRGDLSNHTRVLHPSTWVRLVRAARFHYSAPKPSVAP